jgi:hypothetical protein
MPQEYTFNLESALESYKKGLLFDWTQEYLCGEGNNSELAGYLVKGEPETVILIEFPLHRLKRVVGPEEGMSYPEPAEVFEKRVEKLVEIIKEGKKLPPLIVTDFGKPLGLSDGNHTYEAFTRLGYTNYWTIFFFNNPESKKLLEEV